MPAAPWQAEQTAALVFPAAASCARTGADTPIKTNIIKNLDRIVVILPDAGPEFYFYVFYIKDLSTCLYKSEAEIQLNR